MRAPKTVAWALARASCECACSITVFSTGNHGSPRKTRKENRRSSGVRGGLKQSREFCERWVAEQVVLRALSLFLAAEKRRRTQKIAWGRKCSVFSNRNARHRWGGCFCRAGGICGVQGCSAQRELRSPTIAVNTSGNSVCSCAQDFALSLFFGRGKTRKNAENRMGTEVFRVQ